MKDKENKLIDFLLCLFFGYIGVHKFYEKNVKMGILYLFTGGLCGFGWIIDTIRLLVVLLSKDNVISTESQEHISAQPQVLTSAEVDPADEEPKVEIKSDPIPKAASPKPVVPESKKTYHLFSSIEGDNYLKYEYERDLCLSSGVDAADLSGKGGTPITFVQEPDNKYDDKAVAIYLESKKIGYVYRGRTQDMCNDWFKRDMLFIGHLAKINVAENTATYKIGFYRPLAERENKLFPLLRVTKTVEDFEISSRYDNLSVMDEGDEVDYYNGTVYDGTDELGELSDKAIDFIEQFEKVALIIESLDDNKAKIRVYSIPEVTCK